MYDRHMETPNTPTELLALQEPQEESFASVVEDAIKIEVFLYADDETPYKAKVIGRDALTDSARVCALFLT